MNYRKWLKKLVCYVLMLSMTLTFGLPADLAFAADAGNDGGNVSFVQVSNDEVETSLLQQPQDVAAFAANTPNLAEKVRVSIVLEDDGTIEAGYDIDGIAENSRAISYREKLRANQDKMKRKIEDALGGSLNVKWNLTLAANLISAEVTYGQISTICAVPGVKDVVVEQQYQPMALADNDIDDVASPKMAISTGMTGMQSAWQQGYTGAGSRVAIIDTGIDVDHQSFSGAALDYALEKNAQAADMDKDTYLAGLDLLDAAEVDEVFLQLNVSNILSNAKGVDMYHSSKLPFAFNYVDHGYDYVDHNRDQQSDHGSHVAGIAAANRYIEKDGTMQDAISTVRVAGQAPDAQLLVMKVFGMSGGAFDSDYMAAIEDAIVLGADSINLSLGTSTTGYSTAGEYQKIMENLTKAGAVVCIAAGNEGSFVDSAYTANSTGGTGLLYTDDVFYDHMGSPSSYTNALSVASVDNQGMISDAFLSFGDGDDKLVVGYNETLYNDMQAMTSLDTAETGGTEYDFVMVPGLGDESDYDGIDVEGKIAFISRGVSTFYDKATIAVQHGAIATVIYNNVDGSMGMDMTDYYESAPAISITKADAAKIRALADELTSDIDETYYGGKLRVNGTVSLVEGDKESFVMSYFSSWGSTGDLAMKPEITAPGGSIYSVKGSEEATDKYKLNSGTSMATPQVAGVTAAIGQYIRANKLTEKFGHSSRQIAQSLLMATAVPLKDDNGNYYPLLQQGAGLVNGENAVKAGAYIMMSEGSTPSWADGKVKAELGDDPERTGVYEFGFTVYNTESVAKSYELSAELFAQAVAEYPSAPDSKINAEYQLKTTTPLASSAKFVADGSDLGGKLTVPAGGSVKLTATVTVTDEGKAWLNEHYKNGTYVQGFVFAKPIANAEGAISGSTLHIPLFAFYGNWTDPLMYEAPSWQDGKVVDAYSTDTTTDDSRTSYGIDYRDNNGSQNPDITASFSGTNHLLLTNRDGVQYALGGNPLVPDEEYAPERNAVGSGNTVDYWQYVPLRDATVLSAELKDLTTDKLLWSNSKRQDDRGLCFNSNYWQGSVSGFSVGYDLSDQLTDGEKLQFTLTRLPEYYDAGKMGENSPVGSGATLSVTAVVDNINPKTEEITYSSSQNTFAVEATDENYIAGVVLYSRDGQQVIAYTGADLELEQGETGTFVVKVPGKLDGEYLLQIYDYAMNTATYRITMDKAEISYSGAMLAYDMTDKAWVQVDDYACELGTISSTHSYSAATAVGSTVYAVGYDTELFALDIYDPQKSTYIGDTNVNITDLAYNAADGNLYGVTDKSRLVRINTENGKAVEVGSLPINTNTLACDSQGNFYSNLYGTGKVYSYTLDALATGLAEYDLNGDGSVNIADVQTLLDNITGKKLTAGIKLDMNNDGRTDTYDAYLLLNKLPGAVRLVVDTGIVSKYMQAMECDPNNDTLYWASYSTQTVGDEEIGFSYLFEIDTAAGTYTNCGDFDHQLACLTVLDKHEGSGYAPLYDVTNIVDAEAAVADMGSRTYRNCTAEVGALAANLGVVRSSQTDAPKTVTVNIKAKDITGNGLYKLAIDDSMTLLGTAGTADTISVNAADGTVTVAFAAVDKFAAGKDIVTLTFATKACGGDVTLLRVEENATRPATTETLLTGAHSWGDWQVTTPATCTTAGERTRTCSACAKEETEIIPADAGSHNWGDWQIVTAATVAKPGVQQRTCADCKLMQSRYVLAGAMTATEQDSAFNRINVPDLPNLTLSYAMPTGAGVEAVQQLAVDGDSTMRYLVTLSAVTEQDAGFHVHMNPVERIASGHGSALKADRVESVGWEDNDTEYDITLKDGLASLTVYCYVNETECTPVEFYFQIGESGTGTGQVSTVDMPGYGLSQLEIWNSAGVNKMYYTVDEAGNKVDCYIWLNIATPDDAVLDINPQVVSGWVMTVTGPKWGKNVSLLGERGMRIALQNGVASTTAAIEVSNWGNISNYEYTLHFSNHANQPPVAQNQSGKARISLGSTYQLDLSSIFADSDGDTLSYTYAINGGTATGTPAQFAYTPEAEGEYTIVFAASDGQANSADTYTLTLTVTNVLLGDVNDDGDINAKDVALLRRHIARWTDIVINLTAADMNADESINAKDVALLRRYIVDNK